MELMSYKNDKPRRRKNIELVGDMELPSKEVGRALGWGGEVGHALFLTTSSAPFHVLLCTHSARIRKGLLIGKGFPGIPNVTIAQGGMAPCLPCGCHFNNCPSVAIPALLPGCSWIGALHSASVSPLVTETRPLPGRAVVQTTR